MTVFSAHNRRIIWRNAHVDMNAQQITIDRMGNLLSLQVNPNTLAKWCMSFPAITVPTEHGDENYLAKMKNVITFIMNSNSLNNINKIQHSLQRIDFISSMIYKT